MINASELSDEELLDLLIYQASRVVFSRGGAKDLFKNKKNLKELLHSSPNDLLAQCRTINNDTVGDFLTILGAVFRRLDVKEIRGPILKNYSTVCRWLKKELGYAKREYVCELYLNSAHELMGYQRSWSGTDAHVPFYTREILERVINIGVHRLILIHNHPSGIETPSCADIVLTANLQKLLQDITCELLDHLIITKNRFFSFRQQGFL